MTNPIWRANSITPVTPKRSRGSYWKDSHLVAIRGKNETTFNMWIYDPTEEYPRTGINISLKSGIGGYCQVNIQEWKELYAFLSRCNDFIVSAEPKLAAQEELMQKTQEQIDSFRQQLAAAQQIINQGENANE